ncbi:MAG TPA: hypothetical protein VIJ94_15650 [Caulobacteraceae bacterium]
MKIAVVLIVRDWAALNEAYAFDQAFQALADVGLLEPYYILIAEGFEKVPPQVIERWRASNILIEDCSATLASLTAESPHFAALPENPTHRVTLLRHLILERYFGGEPVLSVDADVVWRMDPHRLFGAWRGGDFALGGSGFLVHAGGRDWFDAYRLGLESALTGGALTADFREAKFGIDSIVHDQHLIRHLTAKGLIVDDWEACRASPALAGLALMHNPLYPKQGLTGPPPRLAFERTPEGDRFSGAPVAFWHMQTSFSMLCSFFFICQPLIEQHGGRLPFPRPKRGRDNLKAVMLHQLREMIVAGQIDDERMKTLGALMFRRGVYKAFFGGKFPALLFSDRYWWESGVFE